MPREWPSCNVNLGFLYSPGHPHRMLLRHRPMTAHQHDAAHTVRQHVSVCFGEIVPLLYDLDCDELSPAHQRSSPCTRSAALKPCSAEAVELRYYRSTAPLSHAAKHRSIVGRYRHYLQKALSTRSASHLTTKLISCSPGLWASINAFESRTDSLAAESNRT